ncbi:MAG: protein translocase subunit SecDF, partial [Bacteroidota bacterium]
MQGKGLIKFFLVVMLLVTAYQYFFVIPTNAVEADADEYAQEQSGETEGEDYRQMRALYLDSISDQTVFRIPLIKSFTYQDLKAQQLNLGLDLKGGMSVVLQVDLREFIRTLARNSKDPTLEEALEAASQAQANAQDDYISLFGDAWQSLRKDKTLAPIFSRNDALRDDIPQGTSDAQVLLLLREQADEAVASTYELLKQRIDRLGVVQPNVSLDADRDLILVELPGIENRARALSFLTAAANLEFYDVKRIDQASINSLIQIDQLLDRREQIAAGRDSNYVEEKTYRYDTLYAADDLGNLTTEIESIDTVEVANQEPGPLFKLFSPNNGNLGDAVLGVASERNLDAVTEMLEDREVARLLPRNTLYRWERSPLPIDEQGTLGDLYALYQLDLPRDGKAPLSGEYVTTANSGPQPDGQLAVNLSMNSEGARIWARMTTEAANDRNRQVAILLDDRVVSAPRVNGPIPGGNTAITGGFDLEEAEDLANMLRVGRLPARTEPIQVSVVGPSLGAENISRSVTALVIGFLLVLVFMMFYYGGAGIVSIIALLLNLVFIFGCL